MVFLCIDDCTNLLNPFMTRHIKILALVSLLFASSLAEAAVFTATGNGNWNIGTTWGGACGAGCVAGVDYPGAGDDAIVPGGILVTIPFFGNETCRNITLDANTAGSLTLAFASTLNITGTLLANNVPTVAIIADGGGQFNFTGANTNTSGNPFALANDMIVFWNAAAPLPICNFNLAAVKTISGTNAAIAFAANVNINSGTLQVGQFLTGMSLTGAASTLTIVNGATMNWTVPIEGGNSTTNFNTLTLNGTLTTTSYVNAANFTMGSGSTLSTSFNGANQTQGWWFQSTAPTGSISINGASTISFSANAAQNLPAGTYGNLTLDAPVSVATKTLVGSGTLSVGGAFTINSGNVTFTSTNTNQASFQGNVTNNGTWTTTSNQDIRFNGSLAQVIGGSNGITFNDNVIFANSSGVDFNVNATFASTITDNNNPITFTNDFTFTGTTYNQGNGTITFDGSTQQVAGSGDINFEDITLSSTTLSINATNASLRGLLSMTSSTLDADGSGSGSFTLVSDASGTASVGNLTGSTASGNWIVQRYFDGSGDVWRNFGVAVSGATVSGDIVGSGFTINGNDLAHYDETETALGGIDDGWVLQSTFGNSISNTRGYSMWTRDTEITNTVDFVGTLNTGNRNMTVSRTSTGNSANDGWNLVNNPYASTVDWDLMSRSNLDGTVSVWNTATDAYVSWNGSTGGLSNGLIASGQAFWVHSTSGTPTLTITEADKSTSSASFLKSSPLTNHLIVSLIQDEKIDKTYIHFREDVTDNFDNNFDGLKLSNGIYNLSTLAESGESLAINSLPLSGCSKTIKINITNIDEGSYQLKFDDLETFETALKFTLVDNFLSISTLIEEGKEIGFDVTSDPASYGDARFEIQLTTAILDTNVLYEIKDVCDYSSSLTITNAQIGVDYTLEQDGESIVTKKATSSTLVLPLSQSQVVDGLNTFDLSLSSGECSSPELVSDAIEFTINPIQEISSVTNGESCGIGQVLLSASGATANAYYNWYESVDSNDPIPNQNSNEYLTPVLESGRFYYVSITNEAGCESTERVKVSATIKTLPSTDILYQASNLCDLASNLIITNAEVGASYNLMQNGQVIFTEVANDSQLTLPLTEQQIVEGSNIFDLRVELDGCSSEASAVIEFEYYSIKEITSVANGTSCTSDQVLLVAEGAGSGEHYNWYEFIDSVDPITGENTYEFVTPELEETTSYFVSIINANGCESTERAEVIAEIVNLEKPDIILTEDVISTEAIADNYTWYKDGVELANEVGNSIVIVESGDYSVEIESRGCSIKSESLPATILALEELEELGISIYPNPIIDILTIEGNKEKINSIIIYDTKGIAVYRSGNVIPNEINLISIKKGIYIINIATENRTINYRVRK